jgi:SEC-C motif
VERAGRNDPCPCGSGRKYKKCCLGHEAEGLALADLLESSGLPVLRRLGRFAESIAGATLSAIARDEFGFWRGSLTSAQSARVADYLMFDFRPAHIPRRTVEEFALRYSGELKPDQQDLLVSWIDAPRRLFKAIDWSGGFTECADLLAESAAPIRVFDIASGRKPENGEAIAVRPLRLRDWFVCLGPPIAYPGRDALEVAESIKRRHLDYVRSQRIVGIDDFLRSSPKALDEEAARPAGAGSILLP